MGLLATVLSALFAGIGAIAAIWPDSLLEVARSLTTPNGIRVAAAFRIVFGAALLTAASESKTPLALRLVGSAVLITGLATPFIGPERARALLDAGAADGGAKLRIAGTVAVMVGCWFVWSLSPRGGVPARHD